MIENNNIQKWLEGDLPTSELPGGEVSREVIEMVEASADLLVPHTITKEEAWERISAQIAPSQSDAIVQPLMGRRNWFMAAAAAVAILIVAWWMATPTQSEIIAPKGQQLSHVLPDGSTVILNADSRILYSTSDWNDHRILSLEGEAFFEVEKGSTFSVQTPSGTVEVLGTSFNVNTREQGLDVSCFTGKVKVAFQNAEEVILTPGEAVKKQSVTNAVDYAINVNEEIAWRRGEFIYEDAPLSTVIEELERQFDVKIDVKAEDGNRIYTGYFSNDDLKEALKLVFKTFGLNYTFVSNSHISISS